jgi:beta-glucosidase
MEWTILEKCGTTIVGLDCDGDGDSIDEAAQVAAQVDTVFVCIGEEAYAEKPGDLHSLDLVPGQVELVRRLREANAKAKIIVIYFGGRTRLLGDIPTMADAVLVAFLPGPDAGKAVMNVLTGSYNPSGRLPITYPKYQDGSGAPYLHPISEMCTQSDYENQPLPHYGLAPSCEV